MSEQKAIMLFRTNLPLFDAMTDAEVGRLIKAMYEYEYKEVTEDQNRLADKEGIIFQMIKLQMDDCRAKYAQTIENRKKAGSKGGYQKKANASKSYQMLASASKSKQDVANVANKIKQNKIKEIGSSPIINDEGVDD